MRGLPFALTSGPLLAQLMRDASLDPRRYRQCVCCGARMPVKPDVPEQKVRCPACARWQQVGVSEEVPWRLTVASAEALRRTRTWLRRL